MAKLIIGFMVGMAINTLFGAFLYLFTSNIDGEVICVVLFFLSFTFFAFLVTLFNNIDKLKSGLKKLSLEK